MIPMVMSASSSFMLPISTPHNAIMFATGKIKISDMVRFKRNNFLII